MTKKEREQKIEVLERKLEKIEGRIKKNWEITNAKLEALKEYILINIFS